MSSNRLALYSGNKKTQRFIEENSQVITETGCWLWMKSLTTRGLYGQVGYRTYGTEKAHRLSFAAFNGYEGMSGKLVCHKCDVPACVNPAHLFLGDCLDNSRDMIKKGRGNYARYAKAARKLSAEQVREIRASNLSQEVLARIYGVSGGTIGQARRRNQYKEIV